MSGAALPFRTGVAIALLAAMLSVAATTGAQEATPIRVDPAMSKGPIDAPVIIVEFSDYQ